MPDDVLATGGEGDAGILMQFLEGKPILSAAGGSNTADGTRTVQHLGAALSHMWRIHGSHGFHHSDPNYPYAIRR